MRVRDVVTPQSVENAFRLLLAIAGSTNAVIHLTAIAGRVGIRFPLSRLNELSATTPVLVNLKPAGAHYMEDLYSAGGVGAVLRELASANLLNLDCQDVTGTSLKERLNQPDHYVNREIVRTVADPFERQGGLVALFGSLSPTGAVLKRAAASEDLLEHEGRAVVFDGLEDLDRRIDDPNLDVTRDDILVLKNVGPVAIGMPEAGFLPIPLKLARAGVKDMVRISDCRMSGTAYGTVVLHVTPEAYVGGPLCFVQSGDRIRLSVKAKSLDLLVDKAELSRRRALYRPPVLPQRGWAGLYPRAVQQADLGADFDFLTQAGGFKLRSES